MPAVTQVILFDDKAWPERVPAEEVVRVTVHRQAIEGEERGQEGVELYLTTEGREELEADLKRWFELGHRPGSKGAPKRGSNSPTRKKYRRDQRKFADAHGLRNKKDPRYPAYETATGAPGYYPQWLDDAFEDWLAAGCPAPPQQKAG